MRQPPSRISIHAPRTGSDAPQHDTAAPVCHFNPRSPHGERPARPGGHPAPCHFNPRSPHGERRRSIQLGGQLPHFNPRSPHGERRDHRQPAPERVHFNPRSPHGERHLRGQAGARPLHFNPRSPHGERPGGGAGQHRHRHFNPRSPHGERPARRCCACTGRTNFNPRSPHGERHADVPRMVDGCPFQSTLPARGATDGNVRRGDSGRFQSTLPARGATGGRRHKATQHLLPISIHAPRTGTFMGFKRPIFNPRSPHGERLRKVTILSIRIIGFAQKVYHKTVLLRISLAENAVILPEKPRNPVRTSLQKAGGLRFARAIRAARPYSISSPSGA